ncbi:hypothetical protein Hypma_016294 [Hypsizygus marmoreus]|uniref:Uncharacterized protein n=1 Tax=Hypsizygus marmoreus TaxID=39966 RepID=A0A369J4E1_HYPMA|nr:hypothetical protein Hypma_016294 [Hypsizygus marmoreus]
MYNTNSHMRMLTCFVNFASFFIFHALSTQLKYLLPSITIPHPQEDLDISTFISSLRYPEICKIIYRESPAARQAPPN